MSAGLYNPGDTRDSCGFGLIAQLQGQASHKLLQCAMESLTCMTHRGAIAADGKTGDGCGLLLQKPDLFLREISRAHFKTVLHDSYAVGTVFLSNKKQLADKSRSCLAQQLKSQGLELVGWRPVPVNTCVCGEIALQTLPCIEQVFVNSNATLNERQFDARLTLARRQAEQSLSIDKDFYICSLSSKMLSYKALVMPADLSEFYPDLENRSLETAIAIFHQRFSTNTLPKWRLSQPYRLLAHNGEINTISGNRNAVEARFSKFNTNNLVDLCRIRPLVNSSGSDSSCLDNMLELLLCGGMDLHRALRMLIPPAWQNIETMDADLRALHQYNSLQMESWDGPAGIVLSDGRRAVCLLDRNGLRPARYVITKNGFITVASETGTCAYRSEDVIKKGRLGPGQILSVDTKTSQLLFTADIDDKLKGANPYKKWLNEQSISVESLLDDDCEQQVISASELKCYMKMFQLSCEEQDQVIRPMARDGQEAVGSMGDDTPLAVLSIRCRSLYDYFHQLFAQVTNPPIDPIRESIVMSLGTHIGAEGDVFTETCAHARRLLLSTPVLSANKFLQILAMEQREFSSAIIDLNYGEKGGDYQRALLDIADQAECAIRAGKVIVVLSDRNITEGKLPIHALLATGAVHHRLIDKGLRCDASIIVETATVRDSHHLATLLGFGATAVYPYLSYYLLDELIDKSELLADRAVAHRLYRKALNKGLMKILSKMGISTIASYRGAQLFEVIGLSDQIIELCFRGVSSRLQGCQLEDLRREQQHLAKRAWSVREPIERGGLFKYVYGSEYHAFNPEVVCRLHDAVSSGDYQQYQCYANLVNTQPVVALRDLLQLRNCPLPANHLIEESSIPAINIDLVEPQAEILKRFDSAAMSLGALSPEAHEVFACAMNRLGGRSNSGEGGEDAARFGTERVSKIKQLASGRFGVTPHYLVNAEVLQIKIAQGAKPGEGGQLPGGKVNALIARLRYSVPGVTLISPPPHHDIYSIEDLAQLIFDLKQVNPRALVSVKLVSEPGVGTIAVGVAKAYADFITISGGDGGTGASPLTSIRHAGSPWELGLSEVRQALRCNGLRHKVRVQADGGLKTGLDIIKAAILGAESFAFGTAPMLALGCKYLRVCHLNNCATGIATQNEQLRKEHFDGSVTKVMSFFCFVAEEVRTLLAQLGFTRLQDIIGHTELLQILPGHTAKQSKLDLSPLLADAGASAAVPQYCQLPCNPPFDQGVLAEKIVAEALDVVERKESAEFSYAITNRDRSIGARLSGEIARRYGNHGMEPAMIELKLSGTAGQSLGVWNVGGLHLCVEGDANDYVGKGMAGGSIVLFPPRGSRFLTQQTPIMGNTCLYGATGGKMYAAGCAGERFAVRNSGAVAVVEGVGDHCCEYMTGGVVIVLGETGHNFAAGMTGGFAFVLAEHGCFADKYNSELVEICRISREALGAYRHFLRCRINEHWQHTGSVWAKQIVENFADFVGQFWLVKPKAANLRNLIENVRSLQE